MQEEYEVTHFRTCKGALGSWICSQMPGNISNHNPQGENRRKQSFVDVTKENLVRNTFFHVFSTLRIWKLSQELMVWICLCMLAAAHFIITFTSNKRVVSRYSEQQISLYQNFYLLEFFVVHFINIWLVQLIFFNIEKMHFLVKTRDVI